MQAADGITFLRAGSSYLWLLFVKHFETGCALCYHEANWSLTGGQEDFQLSVAYLHKSMISSLG